MKLYESIKRPDNYDKFKVPFQVGDIIQIQEKIDGSNTSVFNDNGKLRLFSRTRELKGDSDFSDFEKYIESHKKDILSILPEGYVMFGEWLGQAKISYNKKAKQGLIVPYYVFDIAYKIENMNDADKIERFYLSPTEAKIMASKIGLEFVPILCERMKLNNYEEITAEYVQNKMSMIDEESIREGVVIKSTDGTKRVKIVATQFSEVAHKTAQLTANPYPWLEKYITPMRIQKFILKVQEKEKVSKIEQSDYRLVFKNLDLLSEDILDEEIEQIKKELIKIIKKYSATPIRKYLDEQNTPKLESIQNVNTECTLKEISDTLSKEISDTLNNVDIKISIGDVVNDIATHSSMGIR